MDSIREVRDIITGTFTSDGAGVKLRRIFGHAHVPQFDPFLLLDEFRSSDPDDYLAGFPWHPHRGIETVTYLISGSVEHADSLGHKGVISTGECQWMTAGSGIIHQEMPRQSRLMWGYQLWVNLPAKEKMTSPRYRSIRAQDIGVAALPDGGEVRVMCGAYAGVAGPVSGITVEPLYLDVSLVPGEAFACPTLPEHHVFAYVAEGSGCMSPSCAEKAEQGDIAVYGPGAGISVRAGSSGLRMLVMAGKPLHQEVAWGGPIVMNTREQLREAFEQYEKGTFIKEHAR